MRASGFEGTITGWNLERWKWAQAALKLGAIDSIAALTASKLLGLAQVTVLAVPIYATLDWMEKLAGVLGPEHLVTDVGSTKRQIAEAAGRLFNTPERAAFLPGHPMAGKERGGGRTGRGQPSLRGTVWLFTDDPACQRSPHGAAFVKGWREWVAAMGAKTLDLDPARHDELVAWVSHLPCSLWPRPSAQFSEEEVGDAPELRDVGGRGLREMTRLGASPYSMWRDIAYTNTEAIDHALQILEQRLAHLRENLRTPELRDEFEQANKFRQGLRSERSA